MDSVVFINKAKCRDCNRCVRVCSANAIKIKNGQASILADKCINCGICIRECPSQSIHFKTDIFKAKELILSGTKTIVSLSPSFAGIYNQHQVQRLPAALKKLGFSFITEASTGTFFVTRETTAEYNKANSSIISSACPAIVNYIEKYMPEKIHNLAPIVSPMIAHAKYLKSKYNSKISDPKIIFISSCIAEKAEADRPEFEGIVDVVLTFQELNDWLNDEGIDIDRMPEMPFDEKSPANAKLSPLPGELIKSFDQESAQQSYNIINVNGFDDISAALATIDSTSETHFLINPQFCTNGCLNGPAVNSKYNIIERRRNLLQYCEKAESIDTPPEPVKINFHTSFNQDDAVHEKEFSEAKIIEVLAKLGYTDTNNHFNCGACGYNTCRENAIAILNETAEIEMCLPYVRRVAETQKNKLFETTPNGVLVLDYHLNIINMNPAFRKYFICPQSIVGSPISYLMDPEPFIKLVSAEDDSVVEMTIRHDNYNIVTHQLMFKLPDESRIVCIFVNITKNVADKTQLTELRERTINQAQELLNHQIDMAQNFAQLLGETAARGEALVDSLMKLSEENTSDHHDNHKSGNWLWDEYTTK